MLVLNLKLYNDTGVFLAFRGLERRGTENIRVYGMASSCVISEDCLFDIALARQDIGQEQGSLECFVFSGLGEIIEAIFQIFAGLLASAYSIGYRGGLPY